jgi:integrase
VPVPSSPGDRRWGTTTTINEAIDGWRTNGWDDLSPSTTRRYESIWKMHVEHSIGQRQIATLSPYDVEQYFRRLKAAGLSQASVRQARAVLHRACRLARRWSSNSLPNPLAGTELPAWTFNDSPEVRSPDRADVRTLLTTAGRHDSRFAAFLRVISATGVRRGEACALRWSDIDLKSRTLRIDESVVAGPGGASIKQPKTRASVRTLAIDSATTAELRRLQIEQRDLATSCDLVLDPDAFAFSSEPGGLIPPYPDTMSHIFSRVRTLANLPGDLHLHSLRHFNATALDTVIPEAQKQARLGWATVRMARHYTDTIAKEDRQAANHLGHLLDDS